MSKWKIEKGPTLKLLTPTELKTMPIGSKVLDIFGDSYTIGKDDSKLDYDTRGGYTAFGVVINE